MGEERSGGSGREGGAADEEAGPRIGQTVRCMQLEDLYDRDILSSTSVGWKEGADLVEEEQMGDEVLGKGAAALVAGGAEELFGNFPVTRPLVAVL